MRVLVPLLLFVWMVGSSNESEAAETLTLKGHSDWVLSVSFSPDGKRLACARDGSLEVWDIHSLTSRSSRGCVLDFLSG